MLYRANGRQCAILVKPGTSNTFLKETEVRHIGYKHCDDENPEHALQKPHKKPKESINPEDVEVLKDPAQTKTKGGKHHHRRKENEEEPDNPKPGTLPSKTGVEKPTDRREVPEAKEKTNHKPNKHQEFLAESPKRTAHRVKNENTKTQQGVPVTHGRESSLPVTPPSPSASDSP